MDMEYWDGFIYVVELVLSNVGFYKLVIVI